MHRMYPQRPPAIGQDWVIFEGLPFAYFWAVFFPDGLLNQDELRAIIERETGHHAGSVSRIAFPRTMETCSHSFFEGRAHIHPGQDVDPKESGTEGH